MAKFEDIRRMQKAIWEKAEHLVRRPLLATEKSTGTRLIAAALDDPKRVTELERWMVALTGTGFADAGVISSVIMESAETARVGRIAEEVKTLTEVQKTVLVKCIPVAQKTPGWRGTTEEVLDLVATVRERYPHDTSRALHEQTNAEFRHSLGEASPAGRLDLAALPGPGRPIESDRKKLAEMTNDELHGTLVEAAVLGSSSPWATSARARA